MLRFRVRLVPARRTQLTLLPSPLFVTNIFRMCKRRQKHPRCRLLSNISVVLTSGADVASSVEVSSRVFFLLSKFCVVVLTMVFVEEAVEEWWKEHRISRLIR